MINPFNRGQNKAFTLIELSIALVIIGLIVGGVLVGQDLIHGSKVRKTISESQEYTTAVNTFKLKYNALPGDMADAFDFWGADCGTNSTHVSAGCNGDGDKLWKNYSGNNSDWGDGRKAWQHLSLAGLIEGNWPGGSAGSTTVPGTNIPKTPLGGDTMWTFTKYPVTAQNTLRLSAPRPPPDTPHFYGTWDAITPEDAYAIDSKLDDGHASSGGVISREGGGTPNNCLNSGNYDLTTSSADCITFFNNF